MTFLVTISIINSLVVRERQGLLREGYAFSLHVLDIALLNDSSKKPIFLLLVIAVVFVLLLLFLFFLLRGLLTDVHSSHEVRDRKLSATSQMPPRLFSTRFIEDPPNAIYL